MKAQPLTGFALFCYLMFTFSLFALFAILQSFTP